MTVSKLTKYIQSFHEYVENRKNSNVKRKSEKSKIQRESSTRQARP